MTRRDVGEEIATRWAISITASDIQGWISRMQIHRNFIQVLGTWLYLPRPLWFIMYVQPFLGLALLLLSASVFLYRAKDVHRRHLILIGIAGLVVLSPLIIAPENYGVLAGDINMNPIGWNFMEWFLGHSLLTYGEVPLWVRYKFSGYPYLGDPQTIVYYPSTILLLLTSNELLAIRYGIVLHAVLSGVFMYCLMTEWKQRPEASFVAGIGFMFGGFFYGRLLAGHLSFLYAYAWIPAILILLEVSLRRRSPKYAVLAGLALSMQFQASVLITLYTGVLVGLYLAWRFGLSIAMNLKEPRRLLRLAATDVGLVCTCLFFAACLSAPKLLATLEALPEIERGGALPGSEIYRGAIHTAALVLQTLLYRPESGAGYPGGQSLPQPGHEYWFYVGMLLPLALCALPLVRRRWVTFFLITAVAMSALLSMGRLLDLLIVVFPVYAMTMVPSRWLILSSFAVPALAALTVSYIESWLSDHLGERRPGRGLSRLRPGRLFAYAIATIVLVDLCSAGASFVQTADVSTPMTSTMMRMRSDSHGEVFRVHTTTYSSTYRYAKNGFEITTVYDAGDPRWAGISYGFAVKSYARYLKLIEAGSYKLLEPLNVKYIVSSEAVSDEQFQLVGTFGNEMLYLNKGCVNRVQPVSNAVLIVSSDEAEWDAVSVNVMARRTFDSRSVALIWEKSLESFTLDELRRFDLIQVDYSHESELSDRLLRDYVAGGGRVLSLAQPFPDSALSQLGGRSEGTDLRISRYTSNQLMAQISTPREQFVLISEIFFPGWRITIDGKEATILRADGVFFGVFVGAGVHTLLVEFKPQYFDVGIASSLFAYVALLVMFIPRRQLARLRRLPRILLGLNPQSSAL